MANRKSKHPLDLLHHRLWADDLHEIIRELQGRQVRAVHENDVLDFLFSKNRTDPETRELVRQIQKSLSRAIELNRRILSIRAKHSRELEDAFYEEEDEEPTNIFHLEAQLISEH